MKMASKRSQPGVVHFGRSRKKHVIVSVRNIRPRDREPSRVPMRKLLRLFKKNKYTRKNVRSYISNYVPHSSVLKDLLYGFNRSYIFERQANVPGNSKHIKSHTSVKYESSAHMTRIDACLIQTRTSKHKKMPVVCLLCYSNYGNITINYKEAQRFSASVKKILMSGDVQLNPGPSNIRSLISRHSSLLVSRLAEHRLIPFDVGGGGDCFFRAVSHQLFGNPDFHPLVRSIGVEYLTLNPERFIESNTEHSWLQYLTNMSMQGTWADALIIQGVADSLNLSIKKIESNENFAALMMFPFPK